jgi:hypothetical protein
LPTKPDWVTTRSPFFSFDSISFCFFCWERLLKNMKKMTGRKAISMRSMLPGLLGEAGAAPAGGAPWEGTV